MNGTILEVIGSVRLTVELTTSFAVVEDMSVPMLLGNNILFRAGIDILYSKGILRGRESIPFTILRPDVHASKLKGRHLMDNVPVEKRLRTYALPVNLVNLSAITLVGGTVVGKVEATNGVALGLEKLGEKESEIDGLIRKQAENCVYLDQIQKRNLINLLDE